MPFLHSSILLPIKATVMPIFSAVVAHILDEFHAWLKKVAHLPSSFAIVACLFPILFLGKMLEKKWDICSTYRLTIFKVITTNFIIIILKMFSLNILKVVWILK